MLIIQVITSGLIFFWHRRDLEHVRYRAVIVLAVSLDQLIKFQRSRRANRIKGNA